MSGTRFSRPATWRGFAIYSAIGAVVLILLSILIDQVVLPMIVSSKETITVPNVTGISEDEARTKLTQLGLAVPEPHEQFSNELPAGTVISQMPFDGSTVKEGRRIHLTVSRGIEQLKMPNIKGMTTREARLNLMRLGLALGDIAKERNDSVAADRVIAQSVEAGKTVKTGTTISVLVSEGPESVKLPDLFGVSLDAAKALLNDYGLTVGAITPIATGAFEPNTVIGSVPPADSMVALGDPVSLQVSTNP